VIQPVDLGTRHGYEWQGDAARTAIVLPGAALGGAPSCYYAALTLFEAGWRVVQVWDEFRSGDREEWGAGCAEAALAYAPHAQLIVGKSLTTVNTGLAAERSLRAIWLTPLLRARVVVDGLRAKTAPALLVGGTNDESWDGALARELSGDVLELDGADHGLAKIEHLPLLVDAIRSFAA
jgi:hypothetical protein